MTLNFLLLNSNKTEVVIYGPKPVKKKLFGQSLDLDGLTDQKTTLIKRTSVLFLSRICHLNCILPKLEIF